jgi:chemotaxis protein MotB
LERDSTQAALDEAEAGNAALVARIEDIEAGLAREISEKEAAQLALAQAREEVDANAETARLAAARTEALQALIDDLEEKSAAQGDALEAAEAARLADAAAAEALRARLENADAELTAMSLALEEKRQEAEDTLTLLAAANAIEDDLNDQLLRALSDSQGSQSEVAALRDQISSLEGEVARLNTAANLADSGTTELETQLAAAQSERDELRAELQALNEVAQQRALSEEDVRKQLLAALAAQRAAEASSANALSEAEQRAILLQTANEALSREQAASAESQRQIEALNQQLAALRQQLGSLQALLDDAGARDADADVQISALGSQLNSALAQVAAEQRKLAEEQRLLAEERARRLELEEAERRRLEVESQDLRNYRSEFFGRLRILLGDQEGVRIDGDRFVFSSEVLFQPAKADLSAEGRAEIAKVADILLGVADDIPVELNWVIRVDGHTDNLPLSGTGEFEDNWELSQARALSVVRYMSGSLGIPPERLAANGFGEYQPVNTDNTPEARAQNRRIELKLTEK